MEEDIKVLENMRDNIYGAIQFEDDYQVRITEQKEFDALNLAINHLRKTKLVHSQFIPKSKVKELAKKYEFALNGYDSSTADYKHSQNLGRYLACIELLKEGE